MKEKVNIYVYILIQNSTATCDVSEHSNPFVVKNISFFLERKIWIYQMHPPALCFPTQSKIQGTLFKLAAHSGTQSMGTAFLKLSELFP